MTWRLHTLDPDGKAGSVEVFPTASEAAHWIARLEDYTNDGVARGVFFEVLIGSALDETDDAALGFLSHKPKHGRCSYVLRKIVQ